MAMNRFARLPAAPFLALLCITSVALIAYAFTR